MKLASKLFLSYLIVVLVSVALTAVLTAAVLPKVFDNRMLVDMVQLRSGMVWQIERGQRPMNFDQNFRMAMSSGLIVAGAVSTLVAVGLSWFMRRRIVSPIQAAARASQDVASGRYDKRLEVNSEDELGELAEQFNRMAQSLAETEQNRQQLLADVSHELNTPLASIKGYMEGLEDGVVAPSPETFHLVYREAERLQRLVRDIHEISQLEAHMPSLNLASVEPIILIRDVVAQLQPQYEDKGVKLYAQLPENCPTILADADRIRQILMNLVGNALQYTTAGGCVIVGAEVQKSALRVSVRDTGEGLSPEDIERVFQRFYRVDKSRSRSSGGSGIGLTIAQHYVHLHGGRIWAESAGIGQGSSFHFTIPIAQASAKPSNIDSALVTSSGQSKKTPVEEESFSVNSGDD